MTEDSQNDVRGYGPFEEGAEPTERIAPRSASSPPAQHPPTQPSPSAAGPQPTSGGGPQATTPPTSDGAYGAVPPTTAGPGPSAATPPTGGSSPEATPPTSGGPYAATPPTGGSSPEATPPTSGGPYAATPPTSGGPYAVAPPPSTHYPGPDDTPTSASPYGPSPTSPPHAAASDPTSGGPPSGPTSGTPYSYGPFHGTPTPLHEGWNPADPTPTPAASDPYGLPPSSSFGGRRIEPSPPPDRNRLIIGVVAGLVAGLLVFGAGGWFAGRASAPDAARTTPPTTAAPSPSTTLGVFEQSQVALNEPRFADSGLTAIAQGWLPYLSSCSRNGNPNGPNLNEGEKVRVRCTLDGMSALFVEYKSIADRDKARVRTLGQNVDARSLTPGVGPAEQRATPSGRTTGNYVEYAYKLTEGSNTRIVSGIWWDDAQTPIAAYLLAFWKEGLGERWEPMRDLWSRYA